MSDNNLSEQELAVLNCFMDKKTVEQAAIDLGVPYSTVTRYVRDLKKLGFIIETGFRENRKRYLVTVRSPNETAGKRPAFILWDGQLKPLAEAFNRFSPRPEVSIRQDVQLVLIWLSRRAMNKLQNETPGGPSPADLVTILRRIQVRIRNWDRMIQAIIDAPIWFDMPEVVEKLSNAFNPDAETIKFMNQFELRYLAEGKGALEK